MEVDDEDQIVDEIIKIKNFVFKERMTSKKISDCNLKIDNLKKFIKSNKNLLQHYEKLAMTLKLTHSALQLYKNRTISELEIFKNICMKENKNNEKIKKQF